MAPTSFHDLDDYISLPRVESLSLAPDGSRAVLTVATLNAEKTAYTRALWSIPTTGSGRATRLTRSAKGEAGSAFTASGDVLFVSGRPDAAASDGDDAPQLWLLPAAGGEARAITRLAGGAGGLAAVATEADVVVLSADLLPAAESLEADAALRTKRDGKKVAAILHESYPVRFWDHDIGPDQTHLLALDVSDLQEVAVAAGAPAAPSSASGSAASTAASASVASASVAASAPAAPSGSAAAAAVRSAVDTGAARDGDSTADAAAPYPADLPRPRDLTPRPTVGGDTAGAALTPDGRTLIAALMVSEQRGGRSSLVSIDVASGAHTTLFDEELVDFEQPTVSRDGSTIAFARSPRSTPAGPQNIEIWVASIDGTSPRRIAADWDHWPSSLLFDEGDDALVVTADHDGRAPIFRIPLDGSAVEQLTHDEYAYTNVAVDRSTGDLVALRSSWTVPSHPVRVARDGVVTQLVSPAATPATPGTITEVETTVADGSRVRAWLMLPEGASAEDPAPLLLWIHGGPQSSWNAWSWRWNPNLAVARGWAVLLPDPGLSTGYGLDFMARGWDAWGQEPFTDLMSITDAVVARPDIDEGHTAAMGGSFGGYMANWVAGHTDRFRAIVTHASLWALDQFNGTTDASMYWQSIFSEEGMKANSPHDSIANIVTPMLVIHGDHDYRVPIGEGLRLWSELAEHHGNPDGTLAHKFLYFPDENHWVLKPQHAVIWYQTVFAFLDEKVHGRPFVRPELLG